jgi:hypothetical protein
MRNGMKINIYHYFRNEERVSYENKLYFVLELEKNNNFIILNKNKKILIKKYNEYIKEADKNVNKKV